MVVTQKSIVDFPLAVFAINSAFCSYKSSLNGSRNSDDFKNRPGLVCISNGADFLSGNTVILVIVRIEEGERRHREDLTGIWIHNDTHTTESFCFIESFLNFFIQNNLIIYIQTQINTGSIFGRDKIILRT